MIQQSQAKIFLSGNRSVTYSSGLKSCSTFKKANSAVPALSILHNVKDDVLKPRKTLTIIVEEDADFLLLPVAGTVIYKDSCGNSSIVEAGKVQYFHVKRSDAIGIFNPYDKEFINFIHVWMKPGSLKSISATSCFSFEKEDNKNKLLKLFDDYSETAAVNFFIGKFNGRQDAVFKIKHPLNCLFVFIIEGAFEVQYRLLETRDALVLWDVDEVEIEALSNNAVLWIAEFSYAG